MDLGSSRRSSASSIMAFSRPSRKVSEALAVIIQAAATPSRAFSASLNSSTACRQPDASLRIKVVLLKASFNEFFAVSTCFFSHAVRAFSGSSSAK